MRLHNLELTEAQVDLLMYYLQWGDWPDWNRKTVNRIIDLEHKVQDLYGGIHGPSDKDL